jgi:uncharacterized protein
MKLINKPLVAVGVDPGTTLGYAVVGLDGRILKVGSARGAGLQQLIEAVTYHGKPVIVGTDKAKLPEMVYQFSAKTGARIVAPEADLLVAEKKLLIKGIEAGNSHENDALSSALFALKRFSNRLSKVEPFLRDARKERLADDVRRLIIMKDGLGMADAVRMLEKREREGEKSMAGWNFGSDGKEQEEIVPTKEDYAILKERLRRIEAEYRLLKESQEAMSDELERAGKEDDEADGGNLHSNKRINRILRLREKGIKALDRKLKEASEENFRLRRFVSEIGEKALLKKMDNLGYDELLKRNKIVKIREGDVLLVENPNLYSRKTLDFLKGKVSIIICKQKVTSDIGNDRDFMLLEASKIRLEEERDYALADISDIEKQRKDHNLVMGMFERYRESRKREG